MRNRKIKWQFKNFRIYKNLCGKPCRRDLGGKSCFSHTNASKSAFGSRWLLFFTFILNFGKGALRHIVLACVSLVERRREKLTYWCLVCSTVDEKKNRRSKVLKTMQRRNKPIATPRGKGYNESKVSRHEERPVVTQAVCALRLRCIVDSKFSRWRRRSRNFAGYMLYFSIDTVLSLDSFSRFHKLIFV